jgi:oligopeptidase B
MKKNVYLLITLLLLGSILSAKTSGQLLPPQAPVKPDSVFVHGTYLRDDYSWLRNIRDKQVQKYLKQEKFYAAAMLEPSRALADSVYKEFISRLPESELSHPYFYRGWWYYTRQEAGKAYPIHCRREGSLQNPEQIILDENKLAKGKKYFSLGAFSLSPDQRLLAFTTDTKGTEFYHLFICDLKTGKTIKTRYKNVSDAVWMADSQTLVFTTLNQRMQTDKVLRWNTVTNEQDLLYEELDPGWDISVFSNCDETMLLLACYSKNATESHWLPADDYTDTFTCLLPRREHHIYDADYFQGRFYLRSNLFHPDYDILVCDKESTAVSNWSVLYQGNPGSPVESFLLMADNLVVLLRKDGAECFVTADLLSGAIRDSIITEEPSDLSFWVNPTPHSGVFFYLAESEIMPPTIYQYDFRTHKTEVVRRYSPAGKFDPQEYSTTLVKVIARDGTFIPLRLTFRKDLDLNTPKPIILHAYGAYGDCEDPYFSSANLSYLDRGVILATALVRGGGEFGQGWYDAGRLLNKKNTFYDFIDCMDFLIETGITTPDLLVIEGASAGGLLIGAVVNLVPDKCALAVADVPFVDLMQTMLDASLPLTIQEYEEWGNPADSVYFDYMLSYSPIDNVKPRSYPAMLISTALNDTRVGYWEAVKWVARLRRNNTGTRPVILRISSAEGHSGQADRYRSLQSYAQTVGYVLKVLGY